VRVAFEKATLFTHELNGVGTVSELETFLARASSELGFAYFAVLHHVDLQSASSAIRIHNYPAALEQFHDEQHLACSDPVHRACQLTSVGFAWSELPEILQLTPRDLRILKAARAAGIGDGFTVPAHVPGEFSGSCSFATASGVPLPDENLALTQLVGAFAFQAARRLTLTAQGTALKPAHVSGRERECLIWIARGKSDAEIAKILGISDHTVHQYVKQVRANYDVVSRSQLVARALFAGTISYLDIVGH